MKRRIVFLCIVILLLCSCSREKEKIQTSSSPEESLSIQASQGALQEIEEESPVPTVLSEKEGTSTKEDPSQETEDGMVVFNGSKLYPDQWEFCSFYTSITLEEAEKEDQNCGYQLETLYYEYTDINGNEVRVPYIQVKGLEDAEKETQINQCLELRQTEWITEDVFWIYDRMNFEIMLMTEDYLSIRCYLKGSKNSTRPEFGEPQYFIVMDMKKGENMKLEDLFDLDDFYTKIEAISCYYNGEKNWVNEYKAYREEMVRDMNMTLLEKYNSVSPEERSAYYFELKADWCMVKEGIYVSHSQLRGESSNEVIRFADIRDILKIAEW